MKETEFNWLTRLNELSEEGDGFHPYDYYDLCNKSHDWPTCACGQLCEKLPQVADQAPKDAKLFQLGLRFYICVCTKTWSNALDTFKQIEARTTELLIAMGILKHETDKKPATCSIVPYCVEPGNVPVFKTSSSTFATTASGSTDSIATHRLHSEHGMSNGN